jgi:hypothetical protein
MIYYDDNFGHYNIESDEDIDFYHHMQRVSVEKVCRGCGMTVRIKRDYAYCNACADERERWGGY